MIKQSLFPTAKSFFVSARAGLLAGMAVAALVLATASAGAQVTGSTTTTTDAKGETQQSSTITFDTSKKKKAKPAKVAKDDRVKQSKDTKAAVKKENKYNPLIGKDATLPDKVLYDKAQDQAKRGHFDVARLDLNTLLSTYPDSQYQMRAKLAVADSWYREGGSASLAQAEQEYSDFITFFPNAPESSEAQMRIGDIYMKQMDVPDRDYAKAIKAQDAYRTMLKQYPDAPPKVMGEAKQKLRDVQEVLATREADLGAFYATRENWAASIARFQTVADLYPLYSHMDDVLIGIGDAYAAQSRAVRAQPNMPEGPKAKLLEEYDSKAARYYRQVVVEHSAAPHVEDAKERLAAMNMPIPTPTAEQAAASEELEGSRAQYNLRSRLELLFMRKPNTVPVARTGEPPLEDKAVTTAPTIVNQIMASYTGAFNPNAAAAPAASANEPVANSTPETPASPGVPALPAQAPTLQDVSGAGTGSADSSVGTMTAAPAGGTPTGASLGVEVLTPGVRTGSGAASDLPSATGAQDPNLGLKAVGNNKVDELPAAEAPAPAPDQVNDAAGKAQPPAETQPVGKKKKPKVGYDKDDESSSKHQKKKGIDKINPF